MEFIKKKSKFPVEIYIFTEKHQFTLVHYKLDKKVLNPKEKKKIIDIKFN
jgi:hypothetical protein